MTKEQIYISIIVNTIYCNHRDKVLLKNLFI